MKTKSRTNMYSHPSEAVALLPKLDCLPCECCETWVRCRDHIRFMKVHMPDVRITFHQAIEWCVCDDGGLSLNLYSSTPKRLTTDTSTRTINVKALSETPSTTDPWAIWWTWKEISRLEKKPKNPSNPQGMRSLLLTSYAGHSIHQNEAAGLSESF